MILYVKSHPEDFDELVKLAISNNEKYAWRGSWLLWDCMDENDARIQPFLNNIIDVLESKKYNQKRELIIILGKMMLTDVQIGIVFDICVNSWKNIDNHPSLRYNALNFMLKSSKTYPELQNEIKMLTEPHYLETFTSGTQKSIYKMLQKAKIKSN